MNVYTNVKEFDNSFEITRSETRGSDGAGASMGFHAKAQRRKWAGASMEGSRKDAKTLRAIVSMGFLAKAQRGLFHFDYAQGPRLRLAMTVQIEM